MLGCVKRITAISEEFIAVLVRHSWRGNVQKLQNLIERSVILSNDQVLSGSLPEPLQSRKVGWLAMRSETFGSSSALENVQRSHP